MIQNSSRLVKYTATRTSNDEVNFTIVFLTVFLFPFFFLKANGKGNALKDFFVPMPTLENWKHNSVTRFPTPSTVLKKNFFNGFQMH